MIEWSAWKSCWRTEWCSTTQFIIHEGNSTVKGLSRTHGLHHRSSRILICGVPARNITVTVFFLRIYFCRQIAYGPLRSRLRSLHREDAAIQVDVSYPIEVTCEKHTNASHASRTLQGAEKSMERYSSMKLELLGMKWVVTKKFCDYLLGSKFVVFTDNNPLAHLKSAKLGDVEQCWVGVDDWRNKKSARISDGYIMDRLSINRDIKNVNPDILIVDLGTDDLTQGRPEVVAGRIRGFDSLQIKPLGIFILSVLPHTRPYVQAALSLVDFNWWVQEFNDFVLAESLRRDHVWVWNHIFLQAGLAFFL